jgi:hypothetical protein
MSSSDSSATAVDDKGKDKQYLTVLVFSPRNPADKREFTWSKHLTVGEAATEAATAFGYSGGQPTLAKDGTPLDRSKQLVAEHIKDGDVLELIDAGGGV